MKTYKVGLSRLYNVVIDAENDADAKQAVETFLSNPKIVSAKKSRTEHNFKIKTISMTWNEAFEAKELNE